MTDIPILYTGPMVRAVLRTIDPKLQTRRVTKWRHPSPGLNLSFSGLSVHSYVPRLYTLESETRNGWERRSEPTRCPYGGPGDLLWVRETFFAFGRWETRYSAKKRRDEWHFVDLTLACGHAYRYAADGDGLWPMPGRRRSAGATPGWWKRPAIFMPRAASRVLLEITEVRVERLKSITEADALAEGIEPYRGPLRWLRYLDAITGEPIHNTARDAYLALWDAINGAGSADKNPWVWAVRFRRLLP